MATAGRAAAIIRPVGHADGILDETTRRTAIAQVSESTVALVEGQLRAVKPALENHFLVQLAGWQRIQFYIYEEGDFFVAHHSRRQPHIEILFDKDNLDSAGVCVRRRLR